MLSIVFVAVSRVVRNQKMKVHADKRMKYSLCILIFAAFLVLCDMLASGIGISLYCVAVDLFPSALALWMMSSVLSEVKFIRWGVGTVLSFNPCMLVYHGCRIFMDCRPPSTEQMVIMMSVMALLMVLFCVGGLFFKIADVKELMQNGTIWNFVCMTVDVAYLCFMVLGTAFVQKGLAAIGVLLVGGVVACMGMRILTDSKFVIWQRQETLIAESMKLTSVTSASDSSHIEDVYKELYDRILVHFETNKPYLDSELTINDLVKVLYSNKMYISKAISQFTGRNFCQFVNYYRVKHSMECFRNNQDLRVHELATMNGFNTIVSYSMAFRLFMGETPSEWCRKERSKLIKKGK